MKPKCRILFIRKPGVGSGGVQSAEESLEEALLGVRALVDGALSRMETRSQTEQATQDSTRIPVEG